MELTRNNHSKSLLSMVIHTTLLCTDPLLKDAREDMIEKKEGKTSLGLTVGAQANTVKSTHLTQNQIQNSSTPRDQAQMSIQMQSSLPLERDLIRGKPDFQRTFVRQVHQNKLRMISL